MRAQSDDLLIRIVGQGDGVWKRLNAQTTLPATLGRERRGWRLAEVAVYDRVDGGVDGIRAAGETLGTMQPRRRGQRSRHLQAVSKGAAGCGGDGLRATTDNRGAGIVVDGRDSGQLEQASIP